MNTNFPKSVTVLRMVCLLSLVELSLPAADRYVSLAGGHVSPFTSWADAATNIQAAIDVAVTGDVVWVTNGVYSTGGKVMAGDLTNRVVVDKPITLRSVNGWGVTAIEGAWDPTNRVGLGAVRCVWLTNGALLNGFTVRNGATRDAGDNTTLRSGGGVWCSSTNASIENCLITGNSASVNGGGGFSGRYTNCIFKGNLAYTGDITGNGGGAYSNVLTACVITENSAYIGGGTHSCILDNCVITGNFARSAGGGTAGGTMRSCTITLNASVTGGGAYGLSGNSLTNCIVWANSATTGPNYSGPFQFRNVCSTPLPTGTGNIATDPQLLADGIHISSNSPCRNIGLALTTGTDIDGQSWKPTPAIGCDEWKPEPIANRPSMTVETWGRAKISSSAAGQPPFSYLWLKDGNPVTASGHFSGVASTNLSVAGLGPADAGLYQLVASNSLGLATSAVAQVTMRCVDVNSPGAAAPFTSWATAADNIQAAVEAAAYGDIILVTNGIYAQGGRVKVGDLTNRVALDKPFTVMSASGPMATIIQGEWDNANTNGPGALRCAWLADGASLMGFTLRGGATRGSVGDTSNLQKGGGVWCNSTNAKIVNCIIQGCAAPAGGGAYSGTLINSLVKDNVGLNITDSGGGVYGSSLINCTVTGNGVIGGLGPTAGAFSITNIIINSILRGNLNASSTAEYTGGVFSYSCAKPLPAGTGNIVSDPQLASDGIHLQSGSPCVNAGNAAFASGYDIDGQGWTNPPSMGCDEQHPSVALGQPVLSAPGDGTVRLSVSPVGNPPFACWWYLNGVLVQNDSRHAGAQTPELAISKFDPSDTGRYYVVVSNVVGSVTSAWAQVRVRFVNAANASPTPPFTNWTTAASAIQDAIDIASAGDLVLVTNGTYATGGKVMAGDLTNRVVLDRVVIVTTMNGSTATFLRGATNSTPVNGPDAVRCAWIGNWASLSGFTLSGGATRTNGDESTLQSGGGIWGVSQHAEAAGCLIVSNTANRYGGGVVRLKVAYSTVSSNASAYRGGGTYLGVFDHCILAGNVASDWGGGSERSALQKCLITQNLAVRGGGVHEGSVGSCVLTKNSATAVAGGIYFGTIYNSIIWGNTTPSSGSNYSGSLLMNSCCTEPMPPFPAGYGTNNFWVNPQFVDDYHIATTSPCRGAGSWLGVTGSDIDGEAWLNPPSIGADEVVETGLVGPLSVTIEATQTDLLVNRSSTVIGLISGKAARLEWSFGDGPVVTNASYVTSHAWTNAGDYNVALTVFNTDNPSGVSTNLLFHILPLLTPTVTSVEMSNANFKMQFSTQIGASNTIEFTTNLSPPIGWMTLTSIVSTGNAMQVNDTKATNAARFYRVRAE